MHMYCGLLRIDSLIVSRSERTGGCTPGHYEQCPIDAYDIRVRIDILRRIGVLAIINGNVHRDEVKGFLETEELREVSNINLSTSITWTT
jgi:hypothetical protein